MTETLTELLKKEILCSFTENTKNNHKTIDRVCKEFLMKNDKKHSVTHHWVRADSIMKDYYNLRAKETGKSRGEM